VSCAEPPRVLGFCRLGLFSQTQQEVAERIFDIGGRRVGDIMTPRLNVDWIDIDDTHAGILRTLRKSRHKQLLVGRGGIDDPLGIVSKQDLLNQALDGKSLDALEAIREPMTIHEATPIFRALEQFRKAPVRLALVVDEYGILEGIVTSTDLLEAVAGELPELEGEAEIVEREDGALLIDGLTPAYNAFEKLDLPLRSTHGDFHTIAGFALSRLRHVPKSGEQFFFDGWQFEIVAMDGFRIEKLLARRQS
jgi:CBS domain containing-hemolysin-like protein